MGEGSIDGRGGATLLGQDETWWDLAHQAKVIDQQQSVPRLIHVRQSDGFTLYRITLLNSPNFHVGVDRTNGFTAWSVKIRTPHTARNTDGIDPSSSTNVTITDCDIDTGDDNIAIKSGDSGPAANMTIARNRFYHGHGMSIGSGTSGGVSNVHVSGLTIDGADNGIRIKSDRSRGGLVENIRYENVRMRNVQNPIVLTSMYTTFSGNKLPVYRNVLLKDVCSATPGYVTLMGLDAEHKIEVTYDNVSVETVANGLIEKDTELKKTGAAHSGCSGRFPAFPKTDVPEAAGKTPEEDRTLYVSTTGTGDYWSIQRAVDVASAEEA